VKRVIASMVLVAAVSLVGCTNKKKAAGADTATVMDAAPAPQPVPYQPPAQPEPMVVTPAPEPMSSGAAVSSTPSRSGSAVSGGTRSRSGAAGTSGSSSSGSKSITGKKYTVKPGDTLSKIAQERYGTVKAMNKILKANPGLDADHIRSGQTIVLP
jgi:LysM repeat protein